MSHHRPPYGHDGRWQRGRQRARRPHLGPQLKGPATVVAILCDSGTKYLSKIFNDEWMASQGYDVAAMDASAANRSAQ